MFVEHVTHLMLQLIVDDTVRPFERYVSCPAHCLCCAAVCLMLLPPEQLSWMMIGMAVNVVFTPYGQPLVDERLLLIPYFITAVTVTVISLTMVRASS